MSSLTLSMPVQAHCAAVYEFARNPENLPRWAPGFCHSVKRLEGRWVVESSIGPVTFTFADANPCGVLDHTVEMASGERFYNPMRVIANGEHSELLFTVFQTAGMSDVQLEQDAAVVRGDLETLKRLLESGASSP